MGKLLTVKEAMNELRCSRPTFYKLVNEGILDIVKMGRKTLVDTDDIQKAINKLKLTRKKSNKS